MKKDITALFCCVDDFYQALEAHIRHHQIGSSRNPTRISLMTMSEMVTILVLYHRSPCKNFKYFYHSYLQRYQEEFPHLISYSRFIQLKPRRLFYLIAFIQWFCDQSDKTGISYIDSSSLAVCHAKRIRRHKVFQGLAHLGKSTKGWFMGLKLHLVTNEQGHLLAAEPDPRNWTGN